MKGGKSLQLSMSCGSVLARLSFECNRFRVDSYGRADDHHRTASIDKYSGHRPCASHTLQNTRADAARALPPSPSLSASSEAGESF